MGLTDGEEHKRLLLWDKDAGAESYFAFEVRCVRKFGPAAGIFLRQLVYWTGRGHDPEGWIYKTQAEMEEETGLSRHWQRKARKILGSQGAIEERKRGIPRKLWYRVDLGALLGIMETPHSTMNQWRRGSVSGDTLTQDSSEVGNTDLTEGAPITVPSNEDDTSGRLSGEGSTRPNGGNRTTLPAITESTARTTAVNFTENTPHNPFLQTAENRVSRESSQTTNGKVSNSSTYVVGGSEHQQVLDLLTDTRTKAHRIYRRHQEGPLTFLHVVEGVCRELTGGYEEVERYAPVVSGVLAEIENYEEPR